MERPETQIEHRHVIAEPATVDRRDNLLSMIREIARRSAGRLALRRESQGSERTQDLARPGRWI